MKACRFALPRLRQLGAPSGLPARSWPRCAFWRLLASLRAVCPDLLKVAQADPDGPALAAADLWAAVGGAEAFAHLVPTVRASGFAEPLGPDVVFAMAPRPAGAAAEPVAPEALAAARALLFGGAPDPVCDLGPAPRGRGAGRPRGGGRGGLRGGRGPWAGAWAAGGRRGRRGRGGPAAPPPAVEDGELSPVSSSSCGEEGGEEEAALPPSPPEDFDAAVFDREAAEYAAFGTVSEEEASPAAKRRRQDEPSEGIPSPPSPAMSDEAAIAAHGLWPPSLPLPTASQTSTAPSPPGQASDAGPRETAAESPRPLRRLRRIV